MKIYDKEIYKREQTIRSMVIVIVAFMLGFLTGYFTMNLEKQDREVKQENNTVIAGNIQTM